MKVTSELNGKGYRTIVKNHDVLTSLVFLVKGYDDLSTSCLSQKARKRILKSCASLLYCFLFVCFLCLLLFCCSLLRIVIILFLCCLLRQYRLTSSSVSPGLQVIGSMPIAFIAVAPTGKASFVYDYVQTRLVG